MKKILFVMSSLSAGGAEKALVSLLNSIDYSQYEVDLLLVENRGVNLKYLPDEVNLLTSLNDNNPLFYGGSEFIKYSVSNSNYTMVLRKIWYSILPLISNHNSQRLKTFYAWQFMKPYIPKLDKEYDVAIGYIQGVPNYYIMDCVNAKYKAGWVHNDYSKIARINKEYEYFRKMDKVVTISDTCVESLKRSFPELDNIDLIYNMNSPSLIGKLAQSDDAVEMSEFSTGVKLLTIGRFSHQKGYDMAIEAALILKRKGVDFHWYVLGSGELEQEIKEHIIELELVDYFTLLGIRGNPYPYIKSADIVVQTSRYEGKSIVLDEAKIMAKPIISTNYPSLKDQIRDSIEGLAVPLSPEGIAEGIIRLANNSALQHILINNLKSQDFSQDEILQKHYNLFEGIR